MDSERGLSSEEARKRLRENGANIISRKIELPPILEFLLKFKNPLVIILLLAATVAFVMGDKKSPVIITLMVLISTTLDFINTFRSKKAADELIDRVKLKISVMRDEKETLILTEHLVSGDLVLLEPGNIIPADGAIVFAKDFFVDESSLTGESFPLKKDKKDNVYMGSSVTTGEAKIFIEKTGRETKYSHIAEELLRRDDQTDFDRGVKDFSFLVIKVILVLVLSIFLINALMRRDLLESFLFTVALAVGVTPELLPMIITLNLTKGALAMSRHGVIVKKLSAIQNLGSMDVFCTDKTGTLTEGHIALVKYVDGDGQISEKVLRYAYINSFFGSGVSNPLDSAVRRFKHIEISNYKKIDEIPFDFARRRGSVIVEENDKKILITKGAPEEILPVIRYFEHEHQLINKHIHEKLHKLYETMSQDGFRVLAVAKKAINSDKRLFEKEDEQDMVFLGFVAFLDPPKAGVAETLKRMESYGVEIKVLSGDNELVNKKIAEEIGLPVKGILRGDQISKMTHRELRFAVEKTTIFARVSPDQKMQIVRTLKANGHVTGFMGDGINDSLSLKHADTGISVNNAVDVAKDTADIILVQKSLGQLVNGIIEGRKTFTNTNKYLMMALSSNFGNMFSMAGASLILPFLPMLPAQVLLNNLLYDSSQFSIPLDAVDEEDIKMPRRWNIKFIKKFMFAFAPVSSLYDFITFAVLYWIFQMANGSFQAGWFLESMATQTFVIYIIRTRKVSFIQSWPSLSLILSTILMVVVSWLVVFSGLNRYFGFIPPTFSQSLAITAIIFVYLLTVERTKIYFYKHLKSSDETSSILKPFVVSSEA